MVSAPGKVLLAGGYLVLEQAYPGLVIATASRFYTVVQEHDSDAANDAIRVTVKSPQFKNATWTYAVSQFGTSDCEVTQMYHG